MSVSASPQPAGTRPAAMRLLSDDALAGRAAKGSRRAFEEIYERYRQDLYRFCLAMVGNPQDAQDALQNTMIKVLRALPGETRPIALRPWLYRIARNESVETLRRRPDSAVLEPEGFLATQELTVTVEARERLRELIGDIGELPERQRAALLMRELSDLGFAQIAASFGTSEAVARQTVYEARLSLRQMEAGREMTCEQAMRALSDADGRVLRGRELRAHLRSCSNCRAFREGIGARREDLSALAPLPAAASVALLSSVFGGSAGGSAGALGAGSAAAGSVGVGAGKAVATSAIAKSVATVAVVGAVGVSTADRAGWVDAPFPGGGDNGQEIQAQPEQSPPAIPGGPDAAGSDVGGGAPGADAARTESGEGAGGKAMGAPTATSGSEHQAQKHPARAHKPATAGQKGHGKATANPKPQVPKSKAKGGGRVPSAAATHGQQAAAAHKSPRGNAAPGGPQGQSKGAAPPPSPDPTSPEKPATSPQAPSAFSNASAPEGGKARGETETVEP